MIQPNRLALMASLLASVAVCRGDASAPPKAARSVHLHYPAPQAVLFYNEVTVEQSQNGSYFCACGFGKGYFGIQQKGKEDDKVVIFSVWEPNAGDNPKAVPADRRVEVLYNDKDVEVKRFGGEGTGGQSFYKYPWKIGETCRFLVRAELDPKDPRKTAYAAYFFCNDTKQWKHLATFETLSGGELLKGLYSFIEDFRRDGKSAKQIRIASRPQIPQVAKAPIGMTTASARDSRGENLDAAPRHSHNGGESFWHWD